MCSTKPKCFCFLCLTFLIKIGMKTLNSHPPSLATWSLLQHLLAKIFIRTRGEWEKSTDGGVGGVSVSFVGREREGETSLPTFTQCDCRSRFLFTAITMQWAPFLSSLRNCFPCQSKEVEMKAGSIESLCTYVFDTSHK